MHSYLRAIGFSNIKNRTQLEQIIGTIMESPDVKNSFSIGPLVAYILARENEIKTVRIILSGKQNDFSDDAIRERVREMYV